MLQIMWSRTLFAARSVNTQMSRRMMGNYKAENAAADATIGKVVVSVTAFALLSACGIIPLKKLYGK